MSSCIPPSHPRFASRGPVRQGFTYVGVEQTQDELEVRLFSGDERHLCGVVAVPWFVGRSLVVFRSRLDVAKFRTAASHFAAPWRLCAGSHDRERLIPSPQSEASAASMNMNMNMNMQLKSEIHAESMSHDETQGNSQMVLTRRSDEHQLKYILVPVRSWFVFVHVLSLIIMHILLSLTRCPKTPFLTLTP